MTGWYSWCRFLAMKPQEIKAARKRRKHSLTEAAAVIGVSYMTMRRWERGETTPTEYEHVVALRAYVSDGKR